MSLLTQSSSGGRQQLQYYKFAITGVTKFGKEPFIFEACDAYSTYLYQTALLRSLYRICVNASKCHTVKSTKEFYTFIKQTITIDCLGSKRNVNGFLKLVKDKITRSHYECRFLSDLLLPFCVEDFPYFLKKDDQNVCEQIFVELIVWLMDNVVNPLIRRLFRMVKMGSKISYVPARVFETFQKRVIMNFLKTGYIKKLSQGKTDSCDGKLCFIVKDCIQDYTNVRPIYNKLNLKSNRVLCTQLNPNLEPELTHKGVNKFLYQVSKMICPFVKTEQLGAHWRNYCNKVKKLPLYGVKLDITDAFGNVDMDKLYAGLKITGAPIKHINYIKSIKNIFKIDYGGRRNLYEWKHGLLQGEPLSCGLFTFYRSFLDRRLLKYFETENSFIYRATDDYFYCNTDPKLVESFLEIMQNHNNINMKKTKTVLPHNIKENCILSIGGADFNLKTKAVTISMKFPDPLHHRFRIWNIKRQVQSRYKLVAKQTDYKSNYAYFCPLFQNKYPNDRQSRCNNFFYGMIIVAYRLDCVLQAMFHPVEFNEQHIYQRIRTIITDFVKRLTFEREVYRGKDEEDLIKKISLQAFILVLRRRKCRYRNVLCKLRNDEREVKLPHLFLQMFLSNYRKLPTQYAKICIARELPTKPKEKEQNPMNSMRFLIA